jgi:hypothetical protein
MACASTATQHLGVSATGDLGAETVSIILLRRRGDPELLEERSSKSRSATKLTRNRPQRLLGKVFGSNQYMKGPRQPRAARNLR